MISQARNSSSKRLVDVCSDEECSDEECSDVECSDKMRIASASRRLEEESTGNPMGKMMIACEVRFLIGTLSLFTHVGRFTQVTRSVVHRHVWQSAAKAPRMRHCSGHCSSS